MAIRPAIPADAPAVAAVYAHHVLHGTGTFEEVPPTPEDIAARMAKVLAPGWPWLIAEADGAMLGYAYAAQFRDRSAYRFCCEDSIYIAPDAQRRGVGAALLEALIAECRRRDFRTMLAIIGDSENTGSIGLHERFGFGHIGTMRGVGYKFDRWLDVVTMQRTFAD